MIATGTKTPGAVISPVVAHFSVVAADRQEDARTGQPYYRAELSIDAVEIAAFRLAIVPGMAADVMIETKELTLLVYLVGPLTARMEKAFRER